MTSNGDRVVERTLGMCGGEGYTSLENLLGEKELDNKCKMFAKVTIEPGASVGYHEHHGDTETYYFISGEGLYNDNGVEIPVKPGDVTYTGDGFGHGLKNTGNQDLVFVALILYSDK